MMITTNGGGRGGKRESVARAVLVVSWVLIAWQFVGCRSLSVWRVPWRCGGGGEKEAVRKQVEPAAAAGAGAAPSPLQTYSYVTLWIALSSAGEG